MCRAAAIVSRPRSTEARKWTLPRRVARGGERGPTCLPATTVVVGLSDSVEAVSRDLSRRRIVTIAGPAGIGKTTLAIATARSLRGSFGKAVLFVDLAPIEDPSLVVSTLVSALGLVLRADEPVSAIVDFLRDERLLIVLDNCEQVIEIVAGLADRLLRETVETHLLITSREPLRIAGERVASSGAVGMPARQGRYHRRRGKSVCRRPVVR